MKLTEKTKELWRPVPEYEDTYEASSFGNIKSIDRYVNDGRKNSDKIFKKGKVLNGKSTWDGYNEVCLAKNSERKYIRRHIVIAKTFIENPENKPQVNHKDGNKINNNLYNLEWVTQKENTVHAYKNGLINPARGSKVSKLSDRDVIKILLLHKDGLKTQLDIAKIFNVGKNCIYHIVHRNTWRHIKI